MSGPTLSVGLPVYNGEVFLEEAMDSMLGQTYEDFELIISDNASSDRTEEVCRRYALEDSRIRYVRQPANLGATNNFNAVFRMARGGFFRWASHDDLCAPTLFEKSVESLQEAPPEVVLTYPRSLIISPDSTVEKEYFDNLDLRQESPHERIGHLARHLRLCNAVFGVVRSSALRRTHLFRSFASCDEVLLAELSLLGQFWEIPEPLFLRRMHPQTSVAANPDPASRTRWFDPSVEKTRYLLRWKVYLEELRSIATMPLQPAERVRSVASLSRGYLPRYWRIMAGEIRRAVARNR